MNTYKLYIKGVDNVWYLSDFGNDKPAMNYQSNNLAELKDRQANYSQNLKLPLSKINSRIFGYTQNIEVNSIVPYRKLDCRLFCDEVLISGKSAFITLLKVTDSFEVQILSGTADFFTSITNKKMSELDLGTYEVGSKTGADNYNETDYYCPIAKYGDSFSINNEAYPIVKLLNAITKICNGYGYGFTHNLNINDFVGSNICALTPNNNSMDEFKCWGYINASYSTSGFGKGYHLVVDNNFKNKYDYLTKNSVLIYSPNIDVDINIQNVTTANGKTFGVRYFLTLNGTEIISEISDYDVTHISKEYNNLISLKKGDILNIDIEMTYVDYDSFCRSDIKINKHTVSEVPKGGMIKVADCTGFDKQFDYFKAIAQAFGLFIDVDEESKTVFAYTFKKIIENKSIAKDWSKKLHSSTVDISFQNSSYARNNTLKFKDQNTVIDSSSFIIDNENLEKEKTLFELAFEAGKEYKSSTFSVAEIPLNQTEENGVENFKGGNPHLVKYLTNILGRKSVVHIHSENLIEPYYIDLIISLQKYKLIECEFYLIPEDVEDYNPFIPVWIDFYGAYFYVNKIKNFIAGKLTKVELIKI